MNKEKGKRKEKQKKKKSTKKTVHFDYCKDYFMKSRWNLYKFLQLRITNYRMLSTSSLANDGINCLLVFVILSNHMVKLRVPKFRFNFLLYYGSKQPLWQCGIILKLLVKIAFSMKGFLFFQDRERKNS